ncbi:unnamed protein product [Mytilus coruscus]|uniref:BEN domain-containing protein n=1 Tax=Mytilus coruscus TaxID=42192 RepID=A0A6J8B3U4_MYTCO|nr:unnamed protein product [Mytilus coruscus]
MEAVEQKTTWQGAVDTLLNKLLSEEELRNKSISGKNTVKCGTDGPRPPMDQEKLCKLIDTVINRFPDAKKKGIVEKIQNVQKGVCYKKRVPGAPKKLKSLKERIIILEGKSIIADPIAVAEEESLEGTPPTTSTINQLFNCKTYNQLEDSICHSDSLFSCVHTLLLQLFTINYILSHSVISGHASNSTCIAKPKFDTRLYDTLVSIVLRKYTKTSKTEITKMSTSGTEKVFIFEILDENSPMPSGFQYLIEWSPLAIPSDWNKNIMYSLRKKDRPCAIKMSIDCLMTPEEYGLRGGTSAFSKSSLGGVMTSASTSAAYTSTPATQMDGYQGPQTLNTPISTSNSTKTSSDLEGRLWKMENNSDNFKNHQILDKVTEAFKSVRANECANKASHPVADFFSKPVL